MLDLLSKIKKQGMTDEEIQTFIDNKESEEETNTQPSILNRVLALESALVDIALSQMEVDTND